MQIVSNKIEGRKGGSEGRREGGENQKKGKNTSFNNSNNLNYSYTFKTDSVMLWGWCTGTTQKDGMGREEGGGFRMGNTCITVADSF